MLFNDDGRFTKCKTIRIISYSKAFIGIKQMKVGRLKIDWAKTRRKKKLKLMRSSDFFI